MYYHIYFKNTLNTNAEGFYDLRVYNLSKQYVHEFLESWKIDKSILGVPPSMFEFEAVWETEEKAPDCDSSDNSMESILQRTMAHAHILSSAKKVPIASLDS